MDCSSTTLIVFGTRAAILILCALAGIMCIYLGWRLYQDGIKIKTEGQVAIKTFSIKLASLGPGVFLVGFGIWLLTALVQKDIAVETSAPTTRGTRHTEQESGSFVRVQGSASAPASQPCLIRRTMIKFGTGEQDISAMDVKAAATAAVAGLTAAQSAGIANRQERARTIATLNRLAELAQEQRQ